MFLNLFNFDPGSGSVVTFVPFPLQQIMQSIQIMLELFFLLFLTFFLIQFFFVSYF